MSRVCVKVSRVTPSPKHGLCCFLLGGGGGGGVCVCVCVGGGGEEGANPIEPVVVMPSHGLVRHGMA